MGEFILFRVVLFAFLAFSVSWAFLLGACAVGLVVKHPVIS